MDTKKGLSSGVQQLNKRKQTWKGKHISLVSDSLYGIQFLGWIWSCRVVKTQEKKIIKIRFFLVIQSLAGFMTPVRNTNIWVSLICTQLLYVSDRVIYNLHRYQRESEKKGYRDCGGATAWPMTQFNSQRYMVLLNHTLKLISTLIRMANLTKNIQHMTPSLLCSWFWYFFVSEMEKLEQSINYVKRYIQNQEDLKMLRTVPPFSRRSQIMFTLKGFLSWCH